ncbi:putative xyloglucan endotransglucosylase/hydrolase protein [Trifolium repens]|nr:putative xyloglucan endotransglucosylase/hydrolase protein [Trifolium repens]
MVLGWLGVVDSPPNKPQRRNHQGGSHCLQWQPSKAFQLVETKKTFLLALQDCNRLTISEPYLKWNSEMMPSRRTMGDAIILPNGPVLFINGAQLGSADRSKRSFLFGSIEMLIKLIPGNSAGIVTAYYLSSAGSQHDEINFVFSDNWATRGRLVKTDWSNVPFKVVFHHFRARACKLNGVASINQHASNVKANWWTSSIYKQLNWVRNNFMTYDYCKDYTRFNRNIPHECFKTQF